MRYRLKSSNQNTNIMSSILLVLILLIMIFLIWGFYSNFKFFKSSILKSCGKTSKNCNCCSMPREVSPANPQPENWNCVGCPDGKAVQHASLGWEKLNINNITAKIDKYNIKINDPGYEPFKSLYLTMSKKQIQPDTKKYWPTIINKQDIPKSLCWRSWQFDSAKPNIFEYALCSDTKTINLLLPNIKADHIDQFNNWWQQSGRQVSENSDSDLINNLTNT